jgi:secreted PhoX family phosphatase
MTRQNSRRAFLNGALSVTLGFVGLRQYTRSPGWAADYQNEYDAYGPLIPDPNHILDLPRGFRYTVLSRTGDRMSDGLRTPGAPDGMAAFAGPAGSVIVVRNHELTAAETFHGPFGLEQEKFSEIPRSKVYDAGGGARPHQGGTTTLVYNPKTGSVDKQFLSLAGTCRNCAGGPTPWGSWITCEETVERQAAQEAEATKTGEAVSIESNLNEKDHGYNFEVAARPQTALADPIPLKQMGRFNHEAIAVDPVSGVVFQTEDRGDGLIYRYVPREYGKLASGGRLQALAIRGRASVDTRNWPETGKAKILPGETFIVDWLDMDDVESPLDDLRTRGFAQGAACFARGEGMWYGKGEIFFACTNGGIAKLGQIFRYTPSSYEGTAQEKEHPGRLELYLEPNNSHLVQSCDNVTVAPWGDLIICEDGEGHNFLRGVTPQGELYTLADSAYHLRSELCGACFAPNHPTLFVNIQKPGITLAITGPWSRA